MTLNEKLIALLMDPLSHGNSMRTSDYYEYLKTNGLCSGSKFSDELDFHLRYLLRQKRISNSDGLHTMEGIGFHGANQQYIMLDQWLVGSTG
ncbi:hypothetical protein AB6C47_003035 [Vibrio cyclitrophicus]